MSYAIDIFVAGQGDDERAVYAVLEDADITLDELREEAESGQFQSDSAALAWFRISHLVTDPAAIARMVPAPPQVVKGDDGTWVLLCANCVREDEEWPEVRTHATWREAVDSTLRLHSRSQRHLESMAAPTVWRRSPVTAAAHKHTSNRSDRPTGEPT